MHENIEYKDILRTLYTINNKERSRKTCVLNKELLSLYSGSTGRNGPSLDGYANNGNGNGNGRESGGKEENIYRALVEVIQLVRRDFKLYAMKNKKGRNPYLNTKRKLY